MAQARRRITVLGRVSVERDGVPAPAMLHGRRAELVFAYLAVEHQRTVSREELADALWPDVLPDSWAPALRGVVTDVRRFLDGAGLDAGELLASAGGGYRLQLPGDMVVDVHEAREAVASARARMEEDDPRAAAEHAGRAAGLARLPLLPHHEGPWVDGIRSELAMIHAAALEIEAHAHAEAGDPRAAAAAAERLVRAEPFSEAAHQLLISVLADAGDRAGALRAYEHCRAVLERELGVEPSPETDAVLRRAVPPAAAPAAPAPAAATDAGGSMAGWSVLVVEDHDFQRRTALALLRRLGVGTVAEASGGAAALELLGASSPPDIIVCDLDMPEMDGVEFIRHVAERGLASAVVIASALERRVLDAVKTVSEGYGLQVLGAVEKPLTARNLSAALSSYRPPVASTPPGAATISSSDVGRIEAWFQPIVDLATGRIAAAEAVPVAQGPRTAPTVVAAPDAAAAFTDRMIELICAAGREIALPLGIVLRLPDAPATDTTLADRLAAAVRRHGADPGGIVVAVGERLTRPDSGSALDVIARLRVKGFGLWLDDFGAARLPAERLARIPLTGLRLAPGIVGGAGGDPSRVAALEEALEVAGALELPAVANGSDDAESLGLLLELGCAYAQGTFIAGALALAELRAWAGRWSPPPALLGGSS